VAGGNVEQRSRKDSHEIPHYAEGGKAFRATPLLRSQMKFEANSAAMSPRVTPHQMSIKRHQKSQGQRKHEDRTVVAPRLRDSASRASLALRRSSLSLSSSTESWRSLFRSSDTSRRVRSARLRVARRDWERLALFCETRRYAACFLTSASGLDTLRLVGRLCGNR
jgi:hypothetical protein